MKKLWHYDCLKISQYCDTRGPSLGSSSCLHRNCILSLVWIRYHEPLKGSMAGLLNLFVMAKKPWVYKKYTLKASETRKFWHNFLKIFCLHFDNSCSTLGNIKSIADRELSRFPGRAQLEEQKMKTKKIYIIWKTKQKKLNH